MTISFVIVTFHKRSLLICFTMLRLHTVPSNNIGYDVIKYIICGIQSRSIVRHLNFPWTAALVYPTILTRNSMKAVYCKLSLCL